MPEQWTGALVGKMHVNQVRYADVAEKCGWSLPYVSMILNGSRTPYGAREKLERAVDEIIELRKAEQRPEVS